MNKSGLLLRGLHTGYRGRPVFRDLTLPRIPRGEVVGLLGPNAVGKSTLLKAIAGVRPATGSIMLDAQEMIGMPVVRRARHVGYMPQVLPQATTLVAYEAVMGACRAVRSDLGRQDAEELVESIFDTLQIRVLALRRLCDMSGGQRQMVGLAQVMVRQPGLLLLDEPTSALDLRWQFAFGDLITRVARENGTVCIMAMHDINLALRFCNTVLLLGPSGIQAVGEPTLAVTPATLRDAYGIEARVERCSQGRLIVLSDRVAGSPGHG